VQSLHCCSYDEPIALPTEESVQLALRTQQILAHETGVARVSDPLGGSYYVESLTEQMEKEIRNIMDHIEGLGGMKKAIESGWVDAQFDEASLEYQREVESGERVIVGLNRYRTEEEVHAPAHKVSSESSEKQVARVKAFKENRDDKKVKEALLALKSKAEVSEKENLMECMIDAARASATLSEVLGTLRLVMGEAYDPFEDLSHPFW
jgi:methylmalonyl-CoA mutase N-terminal domain/subunit